MKILFLSNHLFTENNISGSGTWLVAIADYLIQTGEVELYNITYSNVKDPKKVEAHKKIQQLVVPKKQNGKNGLPSKKIIASIKDFVKEVKPDITHVWGTEYYWGLLTARNIIEGPVLLEIQGLISQVRKYIYSGLTLIDLLNCIGPKEIIKPSLSLFSNKNRYNNWTKYEIEILQNHQFISTQSNWVRDQIEFFNLKAQIFKTEIHLRKEFLETSKWQYSECEKFSVFTFSAPPFSYKGLHVLVEAIGALKKLHPEVKLIILGEFKKGIRKSGYQRFLENQIKHYGIKNNIEWVGRLDATGIIKNILKANVTVIPSFIESYSVAVNEALTIGAPVVASYSGAIPEMGVDKKSILYFPPGDSNICAANINRIFNDQELASQLSSNCFKENQLKNENKQMQKQLNIYHEILMRCHT